MKEIKKEEYIDSVHKSGRIWNLTMLVVMLLFPLAVALIFKAVPDWRGLLWGLVATFPMYAAVSVVEVFTYIPMLGAGGAYLSFVTGNISNLKLPCALNALEQAGVKANSDEGEIISTISTACKTIMGKTSCPHYLCPCIIVFRFFNKYSCIFHYCTDKSLCNAISYLHISL